MVRGGPRAAYASAQGLKIGALYEAKSRLRKRGEWPSPRFVRVQGTAASATEHPQTSLCRISLPNGVVVEVAGSAVSTVLEAAARLA